MSDHAFQIGDRVLRKGFPFPKTITALAKFSGPQTDGEWYAYLGDAAPMSGGNLGPPVPLSELEYASGGPPS